MHRDMDLSCRLLLRLGRVTTLYSANGYMTLAQIGVALVLGMCWPCW